MLTNQLRRSAGFARRRMYPARSRRSRATVTPPEESPVYRARDPGVAAPYSSRKFNKCKSVDSKPSLSAIATLKKLQPAINWRTAQFNEEITYARSWVGIRATLI